MDAENGVKQQAFQDRTDGDDNAVQGALRCIDCHECELPELGKAERFDHRVPERAQADGGDTESRREPEDGNWRW